MERTGRQRIAIINVFPGTPFTKTLVAGKRGREPFLSPRSGEKSGALIWISREQSRAETRLQREIEATDRQIDRLVYELYGLTEEEIKMMEGAVGK